MLNPSPNTVQITNKKQDFYKTDAAIFPLTQSKSGLAPKFLEHFNQIAKRSLYFGFNLIHCSS